MPHGVLGARKYIPTLSRLWTRARGARNTLFASEYRPDIELRLELAHPTPARITYFHPRDCILSEAWRD